MRTLYYECFAGLSGDMNLGAMIDLGVEPDYLIKNLALLGLEAHYKIQIRKDQKHGIYGTKVDVIEVEPQHDHDHNHDHDHDHDHEHHKHSHNHSHPVAHHHRTFGDIKAIINNSKLSERVKNDSLLMFKIIAEAEGKIHNKPIDDVHFHEVGAIDSIVDIVGAAICYEALDVSRVMASTVEVGSGFVKCAHGLMPIPAPATAEILMGVPIKSDVKKFEMTTPTGAAILKAHVDTYDDQRHFKVQKLGYGLGTRDLEIPNLVRVMIIEADFAENEQWMLETNIDDMSSEWLIYAEEQLLAAGALDVYKTPIIMKKGRPAIKLSILAKKSDLIALQTVVFKETTSIGMRMYPVEKVKINRAFETMETDLGTVSIKKAYFNGALVNVKPEYEDIKRIALTKGLSIKEVTKAILHQLGENSKGEDI